MRRSELKRTAFKRAAPLAVKPAPAKKPSGEPKRRTRKCALASCRLPFEPRSMTHKACSPGCAEELGVLEKARVLRKERQAGLVKLKRRADWLREAQAVFNSYIRARDEAAGLPCVSCGRHHQGQNHAGHFLSVGAHPARRFDERNVWLQCQPCNVHLSGNALNYRRELVRRIGLAAVEELEADVAPRKYSIEELQQIKTTYAAKLKLVKKAAP